MLLLQLALWVSRAIREQKSIFFRCFRNKNNRKKWFWKLAAYASFLCSRSKKSNSIAAFWECRARDKNVRKRWRRTISECHKRIHRVSCRAREFPPANWPRCHALVICEILLAAKPVIKKKLKHNIFGVSLSPVKCAPRRSKVCSLLEFSSSAVSKVKSDWKECVLKHLIVMQSVDWRIEFQLKLKDSRGRRKSKISREANESRKETREFVAFVWWSRRKQNKEKSSREIWSWFAFPSWMCLAVELGYFPTICAA